jgi:plasmid stabilization system protein ParE
LPKILSRQANLDLEEIFVYISQRSNISIADRVIDSIVESCQLLIDFPEMGRRRPEYDALGFEIRSFAEGSFIVLYTIRSGSAFVGRVIHGTRDIGSEDLFPLAELN